MKARRWLVVLAVFLGASGFPEPARAGYAVRDLGVLPGGGQSQGVAINARGDVAGFAQTSTGLSHAVRFDAGGSPVDLMTLPGGRVSAGRGINASGTVAGDSEVSTGLLGVANHAFRVTQGQPIEDLGVPLGAQSSFATGINSGGQVSGYALYPGNVLRAIVANGPSDFTPVGTFLLNGNSQAFGINDGGTVVGTADIAPGVFRAFVAEPGGSLQNLGTLTNSGGSSVATAINNAGTIVGYSGTENAYRAFRTRGDGSLEDLGTVGGASSMIASAINGDGTVVGRADFGAGSSRAIIYTNDRGMRDLNQDLAPNSGWLLTSATGINDQGQITGTGLFQGQLRAFRLDPSVAVVPEPSALALLAIGLGSVVWLANRRNGLG